MLLISRRCRRIRTYGEKRRDILCRQLEAEDQVLKNKFKSGTAQTFNRHLGDTCVGVEKYLMLMNNKFIQSEVQINIRKAA